MDTPTLTLSASDVATLVKRGDFRVELALGDPDGTTNSSSLKRPHSVSDDEEPDSQALLDKSPRDPGPAFDLDNSAPLCRNRVRVWRANRDSAS